VCVCASRVCFWLGRVLNAVSGDEDYKEFPAAGDKRERSSNRK